MAVIENISDEFGDVIRIKTEVPIIGLLFLDTFTDSTVGETPSEYFTKEFRYSNDAGLNYTDWMDLNTVNIQGVEVSQKDQFLLEYKYTHLGESIPDKLIFNSVTLQGQFEDLSYPIYENTFFKDFFDVNDVEVLGWALNVLEKLYRNGILPDYLQRNDDSNNNTEDKDFITYWHSITHYFALIVMYMRQYENIIGSEKLRKDFLLNKDMALPINENEEDMGYLLYNYITEYRKRGTEQIYYPKGFNGVQIDGELLRSIGYKLLDDINIALLENTKIGWCIGSSSPTWTGTEGCTNLIKGYEYSKEVKDLTKYPIINPSKVSIMGDPNILLDTIRISEHSGSSVDTGIRSVAPLDNSKLIIIDTRLDYEISVRVKKAIAGNDYLSFGCDAFDDNLQNVNLISIVDGSGTTSFFKTEEDSRLDIEGTYYWLRGIVYNKNRPIDSNSSLNFRNSQGLKFKEEVRYISPRVTVFGGVDAKNVRIYDLKVRVLNLPFSQGQLGVKNIITGYVENKGEMNWKNLNEFIQTKLIPYNSFLKIKEII